MTHGPPQPERDPAQEAAGRPAPRIRVALGAAGLIAIAVGGLLLALTSMDGTVDTGTFIAWIEGSPGTAFALVVLLMIVHCFVPFPAEVLALAAGAVLGFLAGALAIWTGAMIGAFLSFGLARHLGRPFVDSVVPLRHREAFDRWAEDQGTAALLLCRLVPIIAFNLVNFAAGLTAVRWRTFAWTTAVGILPVMLLAVWAGSRMRTLDWPWLVGVAVLGLLCILGCHRLIGRALARRTGR
jgi:uncharacterized membrane protein YdjX (TVP38/TMEM64 family)